MNILNAKVVIFLFNIKFLSRMFCRICKPKRQLGNKTPQFRKKMKKTVLPNP